MRRHRSRLLAAAAPVVAVAALANCARQADAQNDAPQAAVDDKYFADGQATLAARRAIEPNEAQARNVILFVADGMGPTTVTAARIFDGQARGAPGEENFLSFEKFPYVALAKTYNTNAQTPDSAGTMSAMATGVKTKIGAISVTDAAAPGDCASSLGAHAATFVELAEAAGLATGVVSTARLTHATPAAAYAHAPDRNWERDTNLPEDAVAAGCADIARQLIEFPYGDGLEIALGGGRSNFLPADAPDPEDEGETGGRRDGRDLTAEWRAQSDKHEFVWDKAAFDAIDPSADPHVLGLFERSHMEYEADRAGDAGGEPSLAEMTAKAIEILSRNDDGYVLLVEAGRIDHAHHGGNARRALIDVRAFADAVAVAREATDAADTLIIATADHGHTLSFAGYPTKNNDILGLADSPQAPGEPALASDGKPYTTLGYANGPGSVFLGAPEDGARRAPTAEEVADLSYRQQATVPSSSETHGGQDVAIYADGPRAHLFGGLVEQSYVFHVIDDALALRKRAAE
ncbi:MAG: alkaline phosphatase [Parvularculaceae bacterium]